VKTVSKLENHIEEYSRGGCKERDNEGIKTLIEYKLRRKGGCSDSKWTVGACKAFKLIKASH